MAHSLNVKVKGIEFENPFILASAPPTAEVESIKKAFSLGWGGAVLKTITPDTLEMKDAAPRFGSFRAKSGQVIGFENFELLSHKSVDYWIDGIFELKKLFPRKVVIASIMAPVAKDEWQGLAGKLQAAPIDALELNFSCPHGMPEKGIGMAIGTDAATSAEITSWVKGIARVPVFAKLTPNLTDIAAIARAVKDAGADGITAINTVQGIIGVDINTLNPLPDVNGHSTYGGCSGPAIKPIGLRCAAQIKAATALPLLGSGGISSWKDAVEYIALGADALQVCTEVMLRGYSTIAKMLAGLDSYMSQMGFSSLDEIRGKALAKITTHEALEKTRRAAPKIDESKCRRCKTCQTVCEESGYKAISMGEHSAIIDADKCDRCSMCVQACPFEAIEANS